MSEREDFESTFGAGTAAKIIDSAHEHDNGVHDNPGSDEFRWACLIAIGFQCVEIDSYRAHHGITSPTWEQFQKWLKDRRQWLAEHDGEFDYLAFFGGVYNEYMPEEVSA